MRAVESEGATVEQAVERALILLDLPRDRVDVEILQKLGDEAYGTVVVRVAPKTSQEGEVPDRPARVSVSRETQTQARDDPRAEEPGEGEQARHILGELLSRMKISCRLEKAQWEQDGERILLSVSGEDAALVIGRQGQTLDAIELILNRVTERRWPGSRPVTVDAEGYRGRRAKKLAEMAFLEAESVRRTGRAAELEPMAPRDRRTIHLALRDEPGVSTHSEGEGADRHVVIEPARTLGYQGTRVRPR